MCKTEPDKHTCTYKWDVKCNKWIYKRKDGKWKHWQKALQQTKTNIQYLTLNEMNKQKWTCYKLLS